jgi:hypothetical protein
MRQGVSHVLNSGRIGALRRRLVALSGYGTESYPAAHPPAPQDHERDGLRGRRVHARLRRQQMFLDFQTWKPVILINLVMAAVAMTIPFLHRYGELAGPVVISLSELIGLFALTYYIGRDAGLHLQYFAATAAFFVIMGLERLKLIATFVLISFALHLACWSWFLQSNAVLASTRPSSMRTTSRLS